MNPLRAGQLFANPVLNIAHRGARAYAPENTLPAFEKAKRFGCQMFELDVHQAKDGELIVHHDDQLWRCTDAESKFPGRGSYYLSDFTAAELALLDAGSWYAKQLALPATQRQYFLQTLTDEEIQQFISRQELDFYASGAVHLPTLQETLELARRLDLLVNVELKTLPRMYPGMADAVVELTEVLAMEDQVLISSFDHEQLQRTRQLNANIATAVLTSDRLVNPGAYLQMLDADAYHPGRDPLGFNSVRRTLETAAIDNIRGTGRGVNVWTINEPAEMRQLIAAGVTGLISDYPNRVQQVLAAENIP